MVPKRVFKLLSDVKAHTGQSIYEGLSRPDYVSVERASQTNPFDEDKGTHDLTQNHIIARPSMG